MAGHELSRFAISIGHVSFDRAFPLLDLYPFVELRLDTVDWSNVEINRFIEKAHTVILCFKQTLANPDLDLDKIVWKKVDYVDIDHNESREFEAYIINKRKQFGIKIIRSIHYFEKYVSPENDYVHFCNSMTNDIFKFVTHCKREIEQNELLSFYKENSSPKILIDLGPFGKKSRLASKELGAPFMYASSEYLQPLAPNQESVENMIHHQYKDKTRAKVLYCGVIGNPIAHSKSPQLFEQAFKSSSQKGHYLRLHLEEFDEIWKISEHLDLAFINITAPFKKAFKGEALNYLQFDELRQTRNTDVIAVEAIISNTGAKSLAVIGTGGAAESCLMAAEKLGLKIDVFGRKNEERRIGTHMVSVESLDHFNQQAQIKSYDFIIWTIPSAVFHSKQIDLPKGSILMDANYNKPLADELEVPEDKYISGKDWLIKQAIPIMDEWGLNNYDAGSFMGLLTEKSDVKKSISLIGMPGVGKSVVAQSLADLTGWMLIDIDEEIEKSESNTISEIVETKGWDYFRNLESSVLKKYLSQEKLIISTGGGIVERKANRKNLIDFSWNVWLIDDLKAINSRLGSDRPMFGTKKDEDRLTKLFQHRKPLYAETSSLLVWNADIKRTAEIIYEEYRLLV